MGTNSIFGNVDHESVHESVIVPAGDPGERLVANLILSTIAFDLQMAPAARKHLAEAHQLAKNLADRSAIYRPPRPSRFVRLTCETEGMTEIIMLPLIGNILVMPVFAGIGLTGGWGATPPAVNVKSLALARILLRLRPRWIASVLEPLATGTTDRQAGDAMRGVTATCMRHELEVAEPLERADGLLMAARGLVGYQNVPLAATALTAADQALEDAYQHAPSGSDQATIILQMKQQIAQMLNELKRSAA